MKKILSLIALGAAFAFAVSCDLSEYNPNQYGEGLAFSSATNIQYALNTFYSEFPSVTSAYSKEQGDVDYLTAGALSDRFTPSYSPADEGNWGGWDDLRAFNHFIEAVETSTAVEGAEKANFIAQGRFFRANWYFSKLKSYGDVPWYSTVINAIDTDNEYKDRDSRDLVVKNIIDDLDYAIANITAKSPDATCIRKEVAQFLKMKVCLYEASFRKYNNITASVRGEAFTNYTVEALYSLAAEAANAIISTGKFSLVPNYRDLFISDALQTKEVILGAQTSGSIMGSQNNYFNYVNATSPRSLSRVFINTYLMKDGSAYTAKNGFETESFTQEFVNRDPRLSAIVRTPGYVFNSKVVTPDLNIAPLGYQIIKFCLDEYADPTTLDQKTGQNSNSTPVYRYAEVLLDYAEAKAELGTLTDEDWANTVGAIRKRAGITGGLTAKPTAVDNYLKSNFYPGVNDPVILEIRRERGCELCLEGQRSEDLLRWGCGNDLATVKWLGLNVPGLDQPVDLDGDGNPDVYLTKTVSSAPAEYKAIAVAVNDQNGLQVVPNGAVSQLEYKTNTERYWAADGHLCLRAIGKTTIEQYASRGYTLTQNPGY